MATQVATVDGPLTNDTITYDYDELGRPVGRAINSVGLTLTYDALGRLSGETNPLGMFGYTYVGATGRVNTTTYPNGQTTSYSYLGNTGDRRLQTIHHKKPDASTLSKFDYTYDVVGNIQTWTQQADSAAPTVQQFRYDTADQLTGATKQTTDPTPAVLKRFAYGYDPAGNRTSEQIDDAVVSASHDRLNRLTSQSVGGAIRIVGTLDEPGTVTVQGKPVTVDAANRFQGTVPVTTGTTMVAVTATDGSGNLATKRYEIDQSGAGSTLTYDANGNLTSDGTRTFEWDARNQLLAINQGAHRSEFGYDGLSHRIRFVEKDSGAVTTDSRYIWCDAAICEERDATGSTTSKRFYVQGSQEGTATFLYSRDHLGSITELADSSAALRARYSYDPAGRATKITGDKDSAFGFTGLFTHAQSGLALAQYRAYDPSVGRWLAEDPIDQLSPTLFAYAQNNPLSLVDPDGRQIAAPVILIGDIICGPACGVAIGAGLAAAALWDHFFATKKNPDFPGYDPAKKPDGNWEWKGKPGSTPGDKGGNWHNPDTNESLRPDLTPPPGIPGHWDWTDPRGKDWRIFPDNTCLPKK